MRISDWSSDVCSSDLREYDFIKHLSPESRHMRFLAQINEPGAAMLDQLKIGRAHVCTPVTNAHLVCRLLLEKKKNLYQNTDYPVSTRPITDISVSLQTTRIAHI